MTGPVPVVLAWLVSAAIWGLPAVILGPVRRDRSA
jgi:hypothetical protein